MAKAKKICKWCGHSIVFDKDKYIKQGYEKGRADVLKDIAKIIDDYACDRDVKSNVSLGQMISQYIYKQTKGSRNE